LSVRPSPALVVPSDLSIGDCVRKMRDHDVGSVLVVRATIPHDLLGIFTERDLVRKIDEVQHGGYWEKTVSTVMSHPVITISVYEMAKAPEMMKRCWIRHLPVIYEDSGGKQHIAGMISMRDLFSEMLEEKSAEPKSVKIAISSRDETSRGILKTLFSQGGKAWVEEIAFGPGILKEIAKLKPTAAVLDLDFVAPGEWASLLQSLNREEHGPQVIALFTPGFHEAKNVAVLSQLEKSRLLQNRLMF
jgi:CBS domain-containing protein